MRMIVNSITYVETETFVANPGARERLCDMPPIIGIARFYSVFTIVNVAL